LKGRLELASRFAERGGCLPNAITTVEWQVLETGDAGAARGRGSGAVYGLEFASNY
jgi:hypothetical protein